MTTQKRQQRSYTALEFHPHPAVQAEAKQPTPLAQLKVLAQRLIHWLVTKPELTVKQKVNRSGNVFWYVYDPMTERTAYLTSEEEVRIWIEERFYYHNHQSQDSSMNFNWHQSRLFR